ncbi:MAG: VCBS repeat-containing protein [Chloroflexi bacterium]|nr:VCBS repeat-containing protein [Chloroflexota bacterium]
MGSGAHVLEVRTYRDSAVVDAFITPAVGPATEPPTAAPIFRHEEDHPALRYDGHPFRQMSQNWGIQSNWQSSSSYNTTTNLVGNTWSLDFEGEWVNLGFHSPTSAGAAEIFLDGVSQGIFQTIGGVNDVISFPWRRDGRTLLSAVVISGTVRPDYIDVGTANPIPEGWHNADLDDLHGLFNFSWKNWWLYGTNQYAYGEDYLHTFVSSNNNIWFSFVGTDLSILGFNRLNTDLQVVIDGVDVGTFDMTAAFSDQPFALHFPDLGAGAHTVQVYVPSTARIDAFHVNPPGFYPYTPVVEWYDYTAQESLPPLPGTGFASSIALGDINGDGVVELIAPSVNGRLYVYRGDGQDAGNGSPIIWSTDLVGPAAEPALADLDNDGTAEIIVSGQNGTFAFRHDGTPLWHNPDVISYYPAESFGWGGPTVGNLDLDPEPEIAIAASTDAVYVLDHEGNTLWNDPIGIWPTVPVLADITGDGILDVIVAQQWELTVYDIFNGGQVAWTYVQTDTHTVLGGNPGAFGAPAVADLDEDGQPEIIINWGRITQALKADGTELWRYNTNNNSLYRPSPITVADVTGDGRPNLITASAVNAGFLVFDHLMMVFDAEGNLLWDTIVKDNTASASGVAVQDLDSDGVWEILWNGATDGFLVLRGADGRRLFNEPATSSGTVLDYPTLGDVDGDGHAEVVVAGTDGLFVIGHDGIWGDSRPLWNQHNYHITNINDDWSVPISEQNSWELHNTYRTQTPDRNPSPSYQLTFTYTEGTPDVSVLTATANITLTANPPLYGWEYRQEWYAPVLTTTFDSLLTNLQPGEVRQVSAGTEVTYRLPSGENLITLPPLYVTVANLGTLEPAEQTAAVGGTAVYTLTLTNSSPIPAVYQVGVGGVPAAWMQAPAAVPLASGETIALPLTVTVPTTAAPDSLPFWVDVDNGAGGSESFAAVLHVVDGLALTPDPASQTGRRGNR